MRAWIWKKRDSVFLRQVVDENRNDASSRLISAWIARQSTRVETARAVREQPQRGSTTAKQCTKADRRTNATLTS